MIELSDTGWILKHAPEEKHVCDPSEISGMSAEEAYEKNVALVGCLCGEMFRPRCGRDDCYREAYYWDMVLKWSRYYRKLKKRGLVP